MQRRPTPEEEVPRSSKRARIVRIILMTPLLLCGLWIGLFWWGQHPQAAGVSPQAAKQKPGARAYPRHKLSPAERKALLGRRRYLLQKVVGKRNMQAAMPGQLPSQFKGEWALVTDSMTGVAMANLAYLMPTLRSASQRHLDFLIRRSLGKAARGFDQQRWGHDPLKLSCNHGHIGYLGHLNLLLAARHSLGQAPKPFTRRFHEISAALVRKLKRKASWIAETYPHERYTSDHAVVMASLALYDRFFPRRATGFAKRWLTRMTACCQDARTGLLAFRLSSQGKGVGSSRGSGAAWDLYYLSHVDLGYTRRQFKKFKRHFVAKVLWFTGIREWPHGIHRGGDVDSGPLVFGLSPAGTGFAVGIARLAGDTGLLNRLLTTADLGGISMRQGKKQFYLFAPLVGEAALLAMRTAVPWDRRYQPKAKATTQPASAPASQPGQATTQPTTQPAPGRAKASEKDQ